MENENSTYNQNTQSDNTQQNFFTKILTNVKSFIELLPIASILLSLVVGFIALRDEILANIKSMWYGIPLRSLITAKEAAKRKMLTIKKNRTAS